MVRAAICADRAFTLYVLGDFAASEADVERAFALLHDEIPTPAIDRLLAPAAWIQVGVCDIRGDVAGAHAGALRLLTLAERIGDQQYIGRAVFGLGVCAWRETRLDEAEAHVHSAQPLVDRAGDTEYVMGCAWLLGCVFVSRGEFDAAEAHFLQALEISKKARHLYFLGLFTEELGKAACGKGDFQSAEDWFRQSLSTREQLGDQRGIAQSWNGLAMVACERGDLAGAIPRRSGRRHGAGPGLPQGGRPPITHPVPPPDGRRAAGTRTNVGGESHHAGGIPSVGAS
jgi:tetratricopeptide (TPR) repeat protein